jgi:hypothetical protein
MFARGPAHSSGDADRRCPRDTSAESPRYVGRAVAALATDLERARWNQQSVDSGTLAKDYGFTDVDGTRPDVWGYIADVHDRGLDVALADYR